MSEPAGGEQIRELRRLRAALGVSADAILSHPPGDHLAIAVEELRFIARLSPQSLLGVWRDLRNRAIAAAADLPPEEDALRLLRDRLESDRAAIQGRAS